MKACALDHLVLEVRDPERSLAFYVGVLGCLPQRAEAFRAGQVPFVSVRVGQSLIDLFPRTNPMPGPNHFCVEVDETPAALLEALSSHGVALERPGRRFGARGDGFSVYIHDPDGHEIEMRTYVPET